MKTRQVTTNFISINASHCCNGYLVAYSTQNYDCDSYDNFGAGYGPRIPWVTSSQNCYPEYSWSTNTRTYNTVLSQKHNGPNANV